MAVSFADMNILITGGHGFIGKNLTAALQSRFMVFAPTHQELDLLDEDRVKRFFLENKIDVVVHCAVVGSTKKTDNLPHIVGYNLRMFLNLVKRSEYFKKIIILGSGAEFNKAQSLHKVTENFVSPVHPVSDYGFSKYLISDFAKRIDKSITLRIFGIYGPHDDYVNRFVSNAICRSVLGMPIIIYQDQVMDFIFLPDLLKIIEYFITHDSEHRFYNIGCGEARSLISIAEKIQQVAGIKPGIEVILPGEAPEYTCDITRLRTEIPSLNFTDFDTSIKEMLEWYKGHKESIDQRKLIV